MNDILQALHWGLPSFLMQGPFLGGDINLLAVLIVFLLCTLLCLGVKASARFNALIVFIKFLAIGVFIAVALPHFQLANWHPFTPFGWQGVTQGAALVFFAYIGFDAISTAAEEAINPQRNVPLGIIVSMLVCMVVYVVVAGLLTGIVPYPSLNVSSPVASALLHLGHHLAAACIGAGAIAGLTSVMLIMYYGLSRVFLAMTRDGLLPASLAKIHPRTHTPVPIILASGLIIGAFAGLVPLHQAAELVNIGTLSAFTLVCAGTLFLRYRHPELPRPFKLPWNPLIPGLGIVFCLFLMLNLPALTWWRFLGWLFIGIILYFSYSQNHSLLRQRAHG